MIQEAVILKCKPEAMFHFGRVGVDADTSLNDTSEFIHSDTLVAALISIAARTFPEKLEHILMLLGQEAVPSVRFSSAFYCIEKITKKEKLENEEDNKAEDIVKEDKLFLLPKPIHFNLKGDATNHKKLKGVKFLSKEVLQKGYDVADWFDMSKCREIQKGNIITTVEEAEQFEIDESTKLYNTLEIPKVAVRKFDKENSFYYQTNLQINYLKPKNEKTTQLAVHFYVLFEKSKALKDEDWVSIKTLMHILADEGIGGERAAGCGCFEGIDFTSFEWKNTREKQYFTVSLTNPNAQTEFSKFKQYQLLTRGGRMTQQNGLLKKVQMIGEGAIVSDDKAVGRIVDLMDENEVKKDNNRLIEPHLRSGICFVLPL